MDRWEYATIDVKKEDLLAYLTRHGLEGWEAVTVITPGYIPHSIWTIVFKRRLAKLPQKRVASAQ